jgi:peptidoglycan/LPS O-acetylase OafA/YrhL
VAANFIEDLGITMATPKAFLSVETALFAAASLIHSGTVLWGFEHARAATAEGTIAAVLALGLMACLGLPKRARIAALVAQVFALLGTLVGAFTIAIGVGPQTKGDYVFHAVLLLLLFAGLVVMLRRRNDLSDHRETA